jgi:hypothetical protein
VPHSAELGIDADLSVINLVDGENFNPEYLKIVSGGHPLLFPTTSLKLIFLEP